jgi:hypothetical protein
VKAHLADNRDWNLQIGGPSDVTVLSAALAWEEAADPIG